MNLVAKVREGVTGTTFVTVDLEGDEPLEICGIMDDCETVVRVKAALRQLDIQYESLEFILE